MLLSIPLTLMSKFIFNGLALGLSTLSPQGINKALLLNSLLGQATSSTVKPSMARQRIVEEERLRVVEAYRYLKKQKLKQQESKAAGLDKLMNL